MADPTLLAIGLAPDRLSALADALASGAGLEVATERDAARGERRLRELGSCLEAVLLEPATPKDLGLLQRVRDVDPEIEAIVLVDPGDVAGWRAQLRTAPRVGPHVGCFAWEGPAASARLVADAMARTRQRRLHRRHVDASLANLPSRPMVVAAPDLAAALRRSEERFRLLVDALRDCALIMLDADGRIESWNSGAERIHGFRAADILGEEVAHLFAPEPLGVDLVAPHLELARVAGRSELQAEGLRRDGSRFLAHLVITALSAEGGAIGGFALFERDVTERVESERHREALLEELSEALASRDLFLSIASHELNTPITGLLLKLQGLLRRWRRADPLTVEEVMQRVASMESHAFRLSHLVRELLDVTRITSGPLALDAETVDLTRLVHDVAGRLEGQATAVGSRFVLPDVPSVLEADPMRLEQIVTNLLSNALRHAPGSDVEVEVGPGPVGVAGEETLSLAVRDHGPGVPEGTEDRIFDRFERLAAGGDRGGLGLGLWITRQVVEACGGRITVERPAEGGARFVVVLPRRGPSEP